MRACRQPEVCGALATRDTFKTSARKPVFFFSHWKELSSTGHSNNQSKLYKAYIRETLGPWCSTAINSDALSNDSVKSGQGKGHDLCHMTPARLPMLQVSPLLKIILWFWKGRTLTPWMNCANWLKGGFRKPTLHSSTLPFFVNESTQRSHSVFLSDITPKARLIKGRAGGAKRETGRKFKLQRSVNTSLNLWQTGMVTPQQQPQCEFPWWPVTSANIPLWIYWLLFSLSSNTSLHLL